MIAKMLLRVETQKAALIPLMLKRKATNSMIRDKETQAAIRLTRATKWMRRILKVAKMLQRVVGVGAGREWVEARHEGRARELASVGCDRPFALRQTRGGVLFDNVALIEAEIEALQERDFGGFVLLVVAEHAAQLL